MSKNIKEWEQFYDTMIAAGILPIGKHRAAKLLALCLVFGDEPFVFNEKLHRDVMIAAKTYKIGPMQIPDDDIAKLIYKYCHDLTLGANWVEEINERYGTDFRNQTEYGAEREKSAWRSMHI